MKELEDRILKDGRVLPGNILKADSFLNHQIDPDLMQRIGETFADHFRPRNITKVLTIEASGIAPAMMTAYALHVPLVFAKKHGAHNIGSEFYTASVHSYTYDSDYTIVVSSACLSDADRVLIIDDFLANGQAAHGLLEICRKAGAACGGIGICIEKGFQTGGSELRAMGYDVMSLALIESMAGGKITFR
jgi:xanthine phosphoribosyltransferase